MKVTVTFSVSKDYTANHLRLATAILVQEQPQFILAGA